MAVAVLVGLTWPTSCGGDAGSAGDATTAPASTPAASTTEQPPATTASTTMAATTTSEVTSTTAAVPGLPSLLVADDDGIRVIASGEVMTTFVAGGAVEVALPDLGGGVVYQQPVTGSWRWAWDDALGRIALDITEGSGPRPIKWIAAPGSPHSLVVPAEEAVPTLLQVVRLDGHPAVLYSAGTADPGADCAPPETEECVWGSVTWELVLQRLDTGEILDLGTIAGFESSEVRYVLGDDLMVVITQSYGEQDVCGAIWSRDDLLGAGGSGVWIGGGGPLWRRCDFGSQVDPGGRGCEDGCVDWLQASIAPDGATIAYAEVPMGVEPAASLVVLDAATREELRRVEIRASVPAMSRLDWDGSYAVLGRGSDAGPIVVAPDGTVQEIEARWAALWQAP